MNSTHAEVALRQDGKGYIDEPAPNQNESQAVNGNTDDSPSLSGSSIEEEAEELAVGVWGNSSGEDSLTALQRDYSSDPYVSDDQDWDVEDEDWELAHGDFTKQYNRARQEQAATQGVSQLGFRLDQQVASSSRPPRPARNHRTSSLVTKKTDVATKSLAAGVAVNPKSYMVDKDKSDRATQDQVLDSRTKRVLGSLAGRGVINEIEYCISTGKEANVYYSQRSPACDDPSAPLALAVKIYRTSILAFRSRKSYIEGEHRFRGEYTSSKNPRKMVRVWAEKELRNLRRLESGGIRVPRAIEQRENVLVMEFLATDASPSPRLKDVELSTDRLENMYCELLVAMRRIYQNCKLVHADLSEYNILYNWYHESHIYIIDVSQSVEQDHPLAFDFLRADIHNVNEYFARISRGEVQVLSLRQTWEYITRESVGLRKEEELGIDGEQRLIETVQRWAAESREMGNVLVDSNTVSDGVMSSDDAVFMSAFIPKNLSDVYDPERDIAMLNAGQGDQLIYAGIQELAIKKDDTGRNDHDTELTFKVEKAVRFEDEMAEGTESEQESEQEDEEVTNGKQPRGFRHEDRESKKERKKAVKEERREKRLTKMPKAEKQRLVKKSAGRG